MICEQLWKGIKTMSSSTSPRESVTVTRNHLKLREQSSIFSAYFNSRQRGVAILIHKNIKFIHNNTITDPEGRFIIINITIHNISITKAHIYGSHNDESSFFTLFLSKTTTPFTCSSLPLSHCLLFNQ